MKLFSGLVMHLDLFPHLPSCYKGTSEWQKQTFILCQRTADIYKISVAPDWGFCVSCVLSTVRPSELCPSAFLVLGMLHNVLDNWLAKEFFLSIFQTAPPEWEQKIQNTYLSIYDSLFWECKASGKPNPWYTWLKNGERLTPEVSNSVDIKILPILLGNFVTTSNS